MKKDSHCSWCGANYTAESWPRKCDGCLQEHYRNPTPVAVALLPIKPTRLESVGLLVVRRNIPPIGKLALPGGYIDFGESWRHGCVRELREEANVIADPDRVELFDVCDSANTVIIYGLLPAIDQDELPPFVDNPEVQERWIIRSPVPLAFPLHEQMAERFFRERASQY